MEMSSTNLICQILGVIVGNAAIIIPIWLWSRAESRSDMREIHAIQAADRRDILNIAQAIREDIKDFHGRLCAIEERNRK